MSVERLFNLMKGQSDPILDLICKHGGSESLVPMKRQVTRNGQTFEETYYVSPGEAQTEENAAASPTAKPYDPASEPGPSKKHSKRMKIPPDMPLDSGALYSHLVSQGFVDKLDNLPSDTQSVYKQANGQYTPERAQLHAQIADHFLSQAKPVPPDKKPVAIMMMGGPGSGKSSATKGWDISDFVPVDPDGIKAQLPEYQEAVKGRALNAARMTHEESSDIAKNIRETALAQRKNVLLDGVGADYDKMAKRVEDLKAKGYHVRLVGVHLPIQEGKRRVAERALNTGRWVPLDFAEDAYSKIPGNFDRLAQLTHDAVAFDNNVPPGEEPRKLYSRKYGEEPTIHEPERYSGYLSGGQSV